MVNVLVTGGNGQLANCLDSISNRYNINLIFKNSSDLDITNYNKVQQYFVENNLDYCVNCAAYTAVDKAESEQEKAFAINEKAVENLANICSKSSVTLIHISTDFVFDGQNSMAYKETDTTHPIGVYGASKLNGEEAIKSICNQYFIVRTSWLYSEFQANFMKTMLRLSETRDELSVVEDQIGTPTYATDLAEVILEIIESKINKYGTYHFSNEGVASWYDFAFTIFEEEKKKTKVFPIKSKDFPTAAQRPHFSVLDKSKIKEALDIEIPHWKTSLKKALINLKNIQKKHNE